MNSIAQQAVPKGSGHRELLRAPLMRMRSVVVTELSCSLMVSTSATLINVGCSICGMRYGQRREQGLRRTLVVSNNQFQAGPDFTDCADFDVDEAERQCEFTDGVLSDIGGDLRRLFRPRDP